MLTVLEDGISSTDPDETTILQQLYDNLRMALATIETPNITALVYLSPNHIKKLDWTARLYYCLVGHLPPDVKLYDSYEYKQRFKALQELFSMRKGSSLYFLCAVPDLILKKNTVSSSVPSTSSACSAMYIDETLDILEIKGQSSTGRTEEFPHAYAQIFAELHFLTTAFMLKELKADRVPTNINCNGLLINKSGQIILFRLMTTIGTIDVCQLEFCCQNLCRPSVSIHSMSGSDVCAAITTL